MNTKRSRALYLNNPHSLYQLHGSYSLWPRLECRRVHYRSCAMHESFWLWQSASY